MDGFLCKEEDEDYGKVSSFRLKSYPVLCRNAISFQRKGKLDWQWKRQGGSSVAWRTAFPWAVLGMTHWHCLTSWHLWVGMGVLLPDFAGAAACWIWGYHKQPGQFSQLILHLSCCKQCFPSWTPAREGDPTRWVGIYTYPDTLVYILKTFTRVNGAKGKGTFTRH